MAPGLERQRKTFFDFFRNPGDRTVGEAEAFARRILPGFFALIFLSTAAGAVLGYLKINNWTMGDWLINYQAGFVRRGFLGEGIFQLSRLSGINAGLVTIAFQLFFYAVFFFFSFLVLKGRKVLFPFILLIFSPFIFMFQVCDFQGGYRKEIIYLALLSFLVWASESLKPKSFTRVLLLVLAVFPLAVLSHEMLVLFLPYLLAVYFQREKPTAGKVPAIVALVFLSVLVLYFCVRYPGNPEQAAAIEKSLDFTNYPVEGGAIAALAETAGEAIQGVAVKIRDFHYFLYLFPLVFSLLAYIPVFGFSGKNPFNRLASSLVLLSVLGSLPLFAVAVDWGRFIHIHLVSIFLLLLSIAPDGEDLSRWRDVRIVDIFSGWCLEKPVSVFAFLFWYFFLWYLPHSGSPVFYPRQLNFLEIVKPFLELAGRI
jgi:hypothetical protein